VRPEVIAMVLGAALLHALWNVRLHAAPDRVAALAISGICSGLVLTPFGLGAPLAGLLPAIGLSALVQTAYAALLAAAYARGELSFTYPVGRGTAPLLTTLGAWAVVGQRPTVVALLGSLALGVGLVVLAAAARAARRGRAVALAAAVGLAIAAYSVVDARAVQQASPVGYLGVVLGLQGLALAAGIRFDPVRLRRGIGAGSLVAIGSIGAYLLVLFAFREAPAGNVATLREISVPIAMALSGERVGRVAWIGATLCVMGALLVAL
jgi:drug/metabolite transporter (DMT)-like permease